tara:strand:- start:119284 stop:120843 length:1560 start_codon:yes stop_codon:yes gene_type:complete
MNEPTQEPEITTDTVNWETPPPRALAALTGPASTEAVTLNNRILVVDDNEAIHEDYRKILLADDSTSELDELEAELFGDDEAKPSYTSELVVELDHASQGEQAIEMVEASLGDGAPYAVIFMDVRMPPGMDGIETTRRVLELDDRVCVVICSAYSDHSWDDISAAFRGTDRVFFLKKPVGIVELRQTTTSLIQRWELARQASLKIHELGELVHQHNLHLIEVNEKLVDQMRMQEELANELRVVHRLEAVGQLAAGVAHEINTPMQYIGDNAHFAHESFADYQGLVEDYGEIIGFLCEAATEEMRAKAMEMVSEAKENADVTYLDEHIPKAFERAFEGVNRVSKIIRAMKDFSHPDSEDKVSCDVNHSVRTTLDVARSEYKYHANVELELGEIPDVIAHTGEINQAILNLIVNAVHAIEAVGGEDLGTITVRTVMDSKHVVRLSVSDTGCGISEDIREKIFDPFFTTKELGKGTGQGLALLHRIVVENHGGTVELETEVGRGSTFHLLLPTRATQGREKA